MPNSRNRLSSVSTGASPVKAAPLPLAGGIWRMPWGGATFEMRSIFLEGEGH